MNWVVVAVCLLLINEVTLKCLRRNRETNREQQILVH
jgi:hypothetical protein